MRFRVVIFLFFLLSFLSLSLVISTFYTSSAITLITDEPQYCEMSYYHLGHEIVDVERNEGEVEIKDYRLLRYVETTNPNIYIPQPSTHTPLQGSPILFLHGNMGNYHQARSLMSRMNLIDRVNGSNHHDYYSIDFHEQRSALSGRLLWRQTKYVVYVIQSLRKRYANDVPLILIGHSMGGILAHGVFTLNINLGHIPMIITLGSPHKYPVIMMDEEIRRYYHSIHTYWSSHYMTHNTPTIISLSGGYRDHLITPHATIVPWITHERGLVTVSTSIPKIDSTIDHQCLCWCRPLMELIASSIIHVQATSTSTSIIPSMEYHRQQYFGTIQPLMQHLLSPFLIPPTSTSHVPQHQHIYATCHDIKKKQLILTLDGKDDILIFLRFQPKAVRLCKSTGVDCEDITSRIISSTTIHTSLSAHASSYLSSPYTHYNIIHLQQQHDMYVIEIDVDDGMIKQCQRWKKEKNEMSKELLLYSLEYSHQLLSHISNHETRADTWNFYTPKSGVLYHSIPIAAGLDIHINITFTALGDTSHHAMLMMYTCVLPIEKNVTSDVWIERYVTSIGTKTLRIYRSDIPRTLHLLAFIPPKYDVQLTIEPLYLRSLLRTMWLQFPALPPLFLGTFLLLLSYQYYVYHTTGIYPHLILLLSHVQFHMILGCICMMMMIFWRGSLPLQIAFTIARPILGIIGIFYFITFILLFIVLEMLLYIIMALLSFILIPMRMINRYIPIHHIMSFSIYTMLISSVFFLISPSPLIHIASFLPHIYMLHLVMLIGIMYIVNVTLMWDRSQPSSTPYLLSHFILFIILTLITLIFLSVLHPLDTSYSKPFHVQPRPSGPHEPISAILFPFHVMDIELPAIIPFLCMLVIYLIPQRLPLPSHSIVLPISMLLLSLSYILVPHMYSSLQTMMHLIIGILIFTLFLSFITSKKKEDVKRD